MPWPVHYRRPSRTGSPILRDLGVAAFTPLVYPHKPGMAELAQRRGSPAFAAAVAGRRARPRRSSPSRTSPAYVGRRARRRRAGLQGARAGRRLRPARPAADAGVGPARRRGRARRRALRQRPAAAARTPGWTSFGEVLARAPAADAPSRARGVARVRRRISTCSPPPERATSTPRWSARRSPRLRAAAARRAARLADVATGSCSAPTSRTSPTPTPSRCAPSRAGRPRTTGSVRRSCAPSCTTPPPACLAGPARPAAGRRRSTGRAPVGWIRDDPAAPRRYPGAPPLRRRKGVNGFDSGCRSRGSVPRKATMISLTMRRKKISAASKRTARNVRPRGLI